MEAFVAKHVKLGEGFSKREQYDALEHPGRRTTAHGYQSAVSWITDLLALRKLIILCSFCAIKFDCRKYHYRKTVINYQGKCDACKQHTVNLGGAVTYVHEETYHQVCVDPVEARRRRRAALGAFSPSRFIQNEKRR